MELRVPGIGGPSPESVLGCDDGYAVPTWRSEPPARSMVRHVAGDYSVHVYDWRPLTSGSRSFVIWPLLLPFTLANVSGWMGPSTRRRGWMHRYSAVLLGLTMTVNCVVWFEVAALTVWFKVAEPEPGETWPFWVGIGAAVLAMGLLVLGATYMAAGFERFRLSEWDNTPRKWKGVWGSGISATIADEQFYDNAHEHEMHWRVHVGAAALTVIGTIVAVLAADGAASPGRGLNWLVVGTGAAPIAFVSLMGLIALFPDAAGRTFWSRFIGVGFAALGVMLLGGLVLAALLLLVGTSYMPAGPSAMAFDVYGWLLLGAVVLAVIVALFELQSAAPGEGAPKDHKLLGSVTARLRARLAAGVRHGDIVLFGVAVSFVIATSAAVIWRWFVRDDGATWRLTMSLPVHIARFTFVLLLTTLVINLVKTKANPEALRRVGNIWDVLTFWPRTFHPFAVRPYGERAVPELRRFVFDGQHNSPLVITADSQGSVLTFAALLPRIRTHERRDEISIVTFGSPLRTLYASAFPACFRIEDFEVVRAALGERWVNVYRCTDHIGRAVFASDAEAFATFLAADVDAPLADTPIRDPDSNTVIQGHNNYWCVTPVRDSVRKLSERRPVPATE